VKREVSKSKREESISIGPENLTRYEKARILAARSLQIAMGAPPLIKTPPGMVDPVEIAEAELEAGVLPLILRRSLPDGTYQDIPLERLLGRKEKKRS
jgi:DNA-directed RNA polymerase subunit K/omega